MNGTYIRVVVKLKNVLMCKVLLKQIYNLFFIIICFPPITVLCLELQPAACTETYFKTFDKSEKIILWTLPAINHYLGFC